MTNRVNTKRVCVKNGFQLLIDCKTVEIRQVTGHHLDPSPVIVIVEKL